MSWPEEFAVDPELVQVAIRTAQQRQEDVAELPLTVLAAAAGISRSTLVRRLGGSRRTLDKAVRAAGVELGGRRPVRQRAVEAAAELIGELGLPAVTLDGIAAAAGCSVHSLYATFGGRDGLLAAVYESYTPLFEIEELLAQPHPDLARTARAVYLAIAAGVRRQPRVVPAMLADALGNPDGPARRLVAQYLPRAMAAIGGWLGAEVAAGRVRPLPPALLFQQLLGPILLHALSGSLTGEGEPPTDIDDICTDLADAFVRAVGSGEQLPGSRATTASRKGHP